MIQTFYALMERNLIPDFVIRMGIRHLLRQRLSERLGKSFEERREGDMEIIRVLKESSIAIETDAANEQHYEVPANFFKLCLGKHWKYSCGLWEQAQGLDESEEEMLELYCQRAQLKDGQRILELGCGWGSLSLFLAKKYPNSQITAVSNSNSQREHIEQEIAQHGLKNLTIHTCDINHFEVKETFDRVLSIEMFEHMRNYQELLEKVSSWVSPGGKLFVHIFCHREYSYFFDIIDDTDWMAKYFFTGGIMPAQDLLLFFQDDFKIESHWHVNGNHYHKTCEAWLEKFDANSKEVYPCIKQAYGAENARRMYVYWRVFFMACSELFRYRGGEEWFVSHYLFEKP